MDTTLDPEKQMIVAEVRRFVDREVIPVAHDLEQSDTYPADLVEKLKKLGIFSATIPEAYGGLGLNFATYARVIEELSRGWMSLAGVVNTHILVAYMIQAYGTGDQRQRFLPAMAEGEKRGAICLSEANAGSDVQAITMTARRDGSDYILNGSKLWVTNGARAAIFFVPAYLVFYAVRFPAANLFGVRNAHGIEDEFGGLDAFITEFFKGTAGTQARYGLFDEEETHATMRRLSGDVGACEHGEDSSTRAICDPQLGTVEYIVRAIAPGCHGDGLHVAARVGF